MPSKLLFNNGALVVRDGSVQIIPDGSTANDCTCCGAGCNTCAESGIGPFDRAKLTAIISGFPATIQFAFVKLVFGSPTNYWVRVYGTVTGLDWYNQTISIEQSGACAWSEFTSSSTANVVFYYEQISTDDIWPYPDDPEKYCSFEPPPYFVVSSSSEFLPTFPIGFSFSYPFGVSFTLPIAYHTCLREFPYNNDSRILTASHLFNTCNNHTALLYDFCVWWFYDPLNPLCSYSCCEVDPPHIINVQYIYSEA